MFVFFFMFNSWMLKSAPKNYCPVYEGSLQKRIFIRNLNRRRTVKRHETIIFPKILIVDIVMLLLSVYIIMIIATVLLFIIIFLFRLLLFSITKLFFY